MYKSKFKQLAKEAKTSIPFPYYLEAMDAAKNENSDEKLKDVFKKYRVES